MAYTYKGSELKRDKVLANFRNPDYRRFPKQRNWRADRDGMSADHLALIRKLPCTCCPSTREIESHHLKSLAAAKERGIGIKSCDRWALSLCKWQHHADVERLGSRREVEWFDQYGIDPHDLANALWKSTGNLERMLKVLVAHKQQAIRILSERRKV